MSFAPRINLLVQPHPVEPSASNTGTSDPVREPFTPHRTGQGSHSRNPSGSASAPLSQLSKPNGSLNEVLNPGTSPEASPPQARKRKLQPAQDGADGGRNQDLLMLPRPAVKKTPKRPRIPPLLQGLHHPPPDARIFPRITSSDTGAYEVQQQQQQQQKQQAKVRHSEQTQHEYPAAAQETLPSTSGQPAGRRSPQHGSSPAKPPAKSSKKATVKARRKWTEDETNCLLKGVAEFGIGNWKKILTHPEYTFNYRTAVDLKDRFRTCCPDQYRKFKSANKQSDKTEAQPEASEQSKGKRSEPPPSSSKEPSKPVKAPDPRSHRKTIEDLAKLGINEPLPKSQRRDRHEFTVAEDQALWDGFQRHGTSWSSIRNDPTLKLSHRKPTDLRDRFRNRWPDKHAVGRSGKSITTIETKAVKKANLRQQPADLAIDLKDKAGDGDTTMTDLEKKKNKKPWDDSLIPVVNESRTTASTDNATDTSVTSKTKTNSHDLRQILSSASPPPPPPPLPAPSAAPIASSYPSLDDFLSDSLFTSEAHSTGSPLVLDRSIVDWAKPPPRSMTMAKTSSSIYDPLLDISSTTTTSSRPNITRSISTADSTTPLPFPSLSNLTAPFSFAGSAFILNDTTLPPLIDLPNPSYGSGVAMTTTTAASSSTAAALAPVPSSDADLPPLPDSVLEWVDLRHTS